VFANCLFSCLNDRGRTVLPYNDLNAEIYTFVAFTNCGNQYSYVVTLTRSLQVLYVVFLDKSCLFNTEFLGLLDSICIMIFELDD